MRESNHTREILQDRVSACYLLHTQVERERAALSLLRIALQYMCFGMAEWCISRHSALPEKYPQGALPDLERLRAPSDGTLLDLLCEFSVIAANVGWTEPARILHATVLPRDASALSPRASASPRDILGGWVALRNSELEGHGIANTVPEYVTAKLDAIEMILDSLGILLPVGGAESDRLYYGPEDLRCGLELSRLSGGDLVCIRRVRRHSSGNCVVAGQRQLSLVTCEDCSWEANDVLSSWNSFEPPSYEVARTSAEDWNPYCYFPDRLTLCFAGRDRELQALTAWANDLESKACMVYGDGGIGKTTLVVEFVSRMLEGRANVTWKPELVTFFTAKQTRWGVSGLERVSAQKQCALDVVFDIVRRFEGGVVARRWLTMDAPAALNKLGAYLAELGISRDQHLLVLDNTETMAVDQSSIEALAAEIHEMSRRIGRVLFTSRRREKLEARPVELGPLTPDESVSILRAAGGERGIQQLVTAGESKLRKYAQLFGNKPLILEVFVRSLSDRSLSLERARDRVIRMQQQDLGEFLFSDAWSRLRPAFRHLLLLLTRVADVADETLMQFACLEVGVTRLEAHDALEESLGIASVVALRGVVQFAFSSSFLEFARNRSERIDNIDRPTAAAVEKVRRRWEDFLRSRDAKVRDRVEQAYRKPAARAAWQAFHDGRYDDCEVYYESACVEDPGNGALFDRYAYFLFKIGKYEVALEKAKRACELAPGDSDSWFTRGLIEARRGEIDEAVRHLRSAQSQGKPRHLVEVQCVHACLNAKPAELKRADEFLRNARESTPESRDAAVQHHLDEVARLENRVRRLRQGSGSP